MSSSSDQRLSCVLQVTVLFAGQHISKSPFEVEIGMAQGDSSKATAQGPGLEPSGNIANKTTYFDVYTAGGTDGNISFLLCEALWQPVHRVGQAPALARWR